MGSIVILNQRGDQTIEWDPSNDESVHRARGAFDALQKEGYEFYEAETQTMTVKGGRVKEFSNDLGRIIAAPSASRFGRGALSGGPAGGMARP